MSATPGRLRSNRDYVRWWAGNFASSVGNQFVLVAMPLMVLLLTGSPFQAGLVASCEALPYIILSLPVGVMVDQLRRRSLLLASGVVSLVALASVPIAYAAGGLTPGQLYAVAFVNGCASVVFAVAQQAALPTLVHPSHLGTATGQAETVERLAAILGPPAAAALFQAVWPALPFLVYAVSFGFIVLVLGAIRADMGPSGQQAPVPKSDLLRGARSLFGNPLLRDLTLLNSAGDLLFAGIGLLMIMLIRDSGQPVVGVGLVFSLAAVGGLIGSLVANRLETRLGVATAVIGKHVLTALLFPILLLDLPAVGVGGLWALISFQVSIVGVIQRKHVLLATPDNLMGRVQSFTTFLSFGSLPIGTAATGFVLSVAGAHGAVVVYTVVLVLLAVFSVASRPIRTATARSGR
jgi:MFS family permease